MNMCACEELPSIIVQNVPALVCTRCGEKVLSQDVMDIFSLIRKGDAPPPSPQPSYVYDYGTVVTWAQAPIGEFAPIVAFDGFMNSDGEETSTNVLVATSIEV